MASGRLVIFTLTRQGMAEVIRVMRGMKAAGSIAPALKVTTADDDSEWAHGIGGMVFTSERPMPGMPPQEAIRRYQSRQRIVRRWLAAPGMVSGGLLICSAVLRWPQWIAYGLFIIFFSVVVMTLALRRCPFCGKSICLGVGFARNAQCPHCGGSLCVGPVR
jgi:hypothetical protein